MDPADGVEVAPRACEVRWLASSEHVDVHTVVTLGEVRDAELDPHADAILGEGRGADRLAVLVEEPGHRALIGRSGKEGARVLRRTALAVVRAAAARAHEQGRGEEGARPPKHRHEVSRGGQGRAGRTLRPWISASRSSPSSAFRMPTSSPSRAKPSAPACERSGSPTISSRSEEHTSELQSLA